MNKIFLASLVSVVSFATAFATLEDGNAPTMELAVGYGAMQVDDSRLNLDEDGHAWNASFRYRLPESPFDIDIRMFKAKFEHDKLHNEAYPVTEKYLFEKENPGCSYLPQCDDITGSSFQLVFNFAKDELFNPYLAAGMVFHRIRNSSYFVKSKYHYPYLEPTPYDYSEDGVTFVGRVGADIRWNYFYSRLEAGYMGEIYDSDDGGQFEIVTTVGFYLCEGLRVDLNASYYTEYESLLTTAGLCLAL